MEPFDARSRRPLPAPQFARSLKIDGAPACMGAACSRPPGRRLPGADFLALTLHLQALREGLPSPRARGVETDRPASTRSPRSPRSPRASYPLTARDSHALPPVAFGPAEGVPPTSPATPSLAARPATSPAALQLQLQLQAPPTTPLAGGGGLLRRGDSLVGDLWLRPFTADGGAGAAREAHGRGVIGGPSPPRPLRSPPSSPLRAASLRGARSASDAAVAKFVLPPAALPRFSGALGRPLVRLRSAAAGGAARYDACSRRLPCCPEPEPEPAFYWDTPEEVERRGYAEGARRAGSITPQAWR